MPCAAAAADVGPASEGRGEAAAPQRRDPRHPRPPPSGSYQSLYSPPIVRAPARVRGPGRQAWRAEGAPLKPWGKVSQTAPLASPCLTTSSYSCGFQAAGTQRGHPSAPRANCPDSYPNRLICARSPASRPRLLTALNRRYMGDQRSPSPSGHITLDIRVILASFFGPICGDDHPYISRYARLSRYGRISEHDGEP